MLDLHHIPNVKDGQRLIERFVIKRGIAIAIPSSEHFKIKYTNWPQIMNARTLLAKEIWVMREYTEVPGSVLLKIIAANKVKYPEAFKK
jgi:hypothetical protein